MIDFTINLREQGFRHWCDSITPTGVLLEVIHEGETESCLLRAEDISLHTNIENLYWRLTGQAREQLGWDWEPGQLAEAQRQVQVAWSNALAGLESCAGQGGASLLGQAMQNEYWKN